MHKGIESLNIRTAEKERAQAVFEWIVEKIEQNGGTYHVPTIDEMVEDANVPFSREPFRQALQKLVEIDLIVKGGTFRKAHYSLAPEENNVEVLDEIPVEVLDEIPTSLPDEQEHLPVKPSEISDDDVLPYVDTHTMIFRGYRGMTGSEWCKVYGVETRVINQARERNPRKFPSEKFAFQLTDVETQHWVSQSVIPNVELGGHNPWFYPLEGGNQLANCLNSSRAIQRANKIVCNYSDLERMAHGDQPKQENFAEAIDRIAQRQEDRLLKFAETLGNSIETLGKSMKETTDSLKETLEEQNKRFNDLMAHHQGVISDFDTRLQKLERKVDQKSQSDVNQILSEDKQERLLAALRVAAQLRQGKYVPEKAFIDYKPVPRQHDLEIIRRVLYRSEQATELMSIYHFKP
jgi:hypothetical protein